MSVSVSGLLVSSLSVHPMKADEHTVSLSVISFTLISMCFSRGARNILSIHDMTSLPMRLTPAVHQTPDANLPEDTPSASVDASGSIPSAEVDASAPSADVKEPKKSGMFSGIFGSSKSKTEVMTSRRSASILDDVPDYRVWLSLLIVRCPASDFFR